MAFRSLNVVRAALAGLLLVAVSASASAQYRFDTWTTETGLPQNSVSSIVQTRDGYLWLGTSGGLVRFDGVRFTVIEAGEDGPRSVRILALHEDRNGALWIATEHGGLTRYADGKFTTYTTKDGLPSDSVSVIFEDRAGRLWLSTDRGLARFEGGRFTPYAELEGLSSIAQIAEDAGGNLWLATGFGLVRLRNGTFTTFTTRDGFPRNSVRSIHVNRDGSLWVGTVSSGLTRFENGKVTAVYTTADGLPHNGVRHFLDDGPGALWIGTDAGLARFDVNSRRVVEVYTSRTGLSDDLIRSFITDREGNLWIGTNTGGLNRMKRMDVTAFGRGEGLPGDGVVPITEDLDGNIWIGMTCGGLVRYAGGAFTAIDMKAGMPNDCIWSLLADRQGRLWVGTWGSGLVRRERDGGLTIYNTVNSGLSGNDVLALYEDRAGALWIGTRAGVNRLQGDAFTVYRKRDGLVSDDVRFITEDRDGALWIGTTAGASRFKDGQFTSYTTAEGLSSNLVRAIHQTGDGTLWFGTYGGGLNRLKDGRFTQITIRQGMFENIVSRILEDPHGFFWMTGNKGIARVRRAELDDLADGRTSSITSIAYGVGDGMRSSECNGGGQPAGWKARDGRLWFPTARGVVSIDPDHIRSSEVLPPVVIEQVLVNRAEQDRGQTIEVPPGPGALEIQYTGISFSAPEYVRFRYRLEGLDDEWTEAGTRRAAYFSRLPPGRYTFSVIAANRDGIWNTESAATLSLRVLPPFYRTWWFTALALGGIFGVLALGHHQRVSRLKQERAAQQAFSQRLIASQEGERKRIAAELHDSLSQTLVVIKNRALLSLQTPDNPSRALEQLDEIAEAATHAIDEVKEISGNLRPYHLDHLGLTKTIDAMLDKVSAANGLRVVKNLDPLDGVFSQEAEINIYRIVQEAVTNIVKHAHATEASVTIERSAREVTIVIGDDGKGFAPDPGSLSPPRGFGLIGIAERTRLLGSEPVIQSAPGHGTTIRIRLDLGKNQWTHERES